MAVVLVVAILSGIVTYCLLGEFNRADSPKSVARSEKKTQSKNSTTEKSPSENKTTESSAHGNSDKASAVGIFKNRTKLPEAGSKELTDRTNLVSPAQSSATSESGRELTAELQNKLLPFGIREQRISLNIQIPAALNGFLPHVHPAKESRWLLGVGVIQNRSGMAYSVNPDNLKYVHKNYLKRMREGEYTAGNIQAGISLGYKLNQKWAVLTGLNYSVLSNRQNFDFSDEVPVTLMPGNKPDKFGNYPIIGYFTPSVPGYTNYQGFSKLSFVEVPIGVSYEHRLNRKWCLIPTATINSCIISGESGKTLDYQLLSVVSRQSEWFRKTVFTASAGVGLYKSISPGLQLGANFVSTRNLTTVYVPDASVRPKAWSAGLGMQLLWRIDR